MQEKSAGLSGEEGPALSWIVAVLVLCLMLGGLPPSPAGASEYDFAIPEADPVPWSFGGRVTARYTWHRLNDDTAGFRRIYAGTDPGSNAHDFQALAELSASWRKSGFQAVLLTHHDWTRTFFDTGWDHAVYEGYVSISPAPNLTLDAGKKPVLWGTGYAWNPTGFLNRTKDPDDPGLNLEGRTFLGLDYIKSFYDSALNNIGITAMILPVVDGFVNTELGENKDVNAAVKLYFLWHDTDIDLIWFNGPDQPHSFGIDFAKNLAPHFAVHGELAVQKDVEIQSVKPNGSTGQITETQVSGLVGLRYLNTHDTTFIAEYYHNGAGYDDFRTAPASALQQRNPGKDYLYVKISQKEPAEILYLNAWMATVINLHDHSFNLQPGLTWTPVTNLEINTRVGIPLGSSHTEFGEKPDRFRPEVWVRYYF
ncbi:MAG: hypothetical protein U5K27_09525 [Desulfotignum sp.]|nr:hypothetical protein [Desulfotignum sp.]